MRKVIREVFETAKESQIFHWAPMFFAVLGIIQTIVFVFLPAHSEDHLSEICRMIPWYAWVIGAFSASMVMLLGYAHDQRLRLVKKQNEDVPLFQAAQRLLDTYYETKHPFGDVVDALHDSEPNSPENKWGVLATRFVKEDVPILGIPHAGSRPMIIAKDRFENWTIKFDENQIAHLINGGTTHFSYLSLVEKDLSEYLRRVAREAKTKQYV